MRNVTIGCELIAHFGEYERLREQWVKAEEYGADALYTQDHLHAIPVDTELAVAPNDGTHNKAVNDNVFECTTILAAMAATTSVVKLGASVHSYAYRNPNMLAYAAATIDQISGGRFLLGMGTGFVKKDFDEFGFEYGTQKERSLALEQGMPIILDRFKRLRPGPKQARIPVMIASMGDKIGLRIVAKYADMWHVYGPYELMLQKKEVLRKHCEEIGRNFHDIELVTNWWPKIMKGPEDTLENYVKMGVTHIMCLTEGPKWDLGELRELVQWQKALA